MQITVAIRMPLKYSHILVGLVKHLSSSVIILDSFLLSQNCKDNGFPSRNTKVLGALFA